MKCTQCDCENLTPINLKSLLDVSGDASMYNSKSLKIYVCRNCGHLEFFDNGFNEKFAEEAEVNKKYEQEINVLVQKQEEIKNGELKQLQEDLACAESQLKSLDITIRQQQELTQKAENLGKKIKELTIEVYKLEKEVKELESKKSRELDKVRFKYCRLI